MNPAPSARSPLVKICGVSDSAGVAAVAAAGADLIGFAHFPPSPRHVSLERAAKLTADARACGLQTVILLVSPDDETARRAAACGSDWLQLHKVHDPARVANLRAVTGRRIIAAAPVADPADLPLADALAQAADWILLDAKPPKGADLPGGNGVAFDWRLIQGRAFAVPWMLAGGLTPETAAAAARLTGAPCLDVSSGVESAPGVKDPALIAAFTAAAKRA